VRRYQSAIHEGPADSANFSDPEPRRRNYALIGQAYHLYDQGLNEHLVGNYGSALDKLTEASNLLDQARSHQRTGVPSTLDAMVFMKWVRLQSRTVMSGWLAIVMPIASRPVLLL
jgi:hypothetical protein